MIQRKQTLWLLLAALCTGLTFRFPFYTVAAGESNEFTGVLAQSSTSTLVTGIATGALCLIAIFLFKTLRRQLWVVVLALLLALLQIVLLYAHSASYAKGNPALTAVLPVLTVVFLVLAGQGINQDEKALRELRSNRLR